MTFVQLCMVQSLSVTNVKNVDDFEGDTIIYVDVLGLTTAPLLLERSVSHVKITEDSNMEYTPLPVFTEKSTVGSQKNLPRNVMSLDVSADTAFVQNTTLRKSDWTESYRVLIASTVNARATADYVDSESEVLIVCNDNGERALEDHVAVQLLCKALKDEKSNDLESAVLHKALNSALAKSESKADLNIYQNFNSVDVACVYSDGTVQEN